MFLRVLALNFDIIQMNSKGAEKENPMILCKDQGVYKLHWTLLGYYHLVEAAGVEPASENIPLRHLHT